jgi:hypothetical protein
LFYFKITLKKKIDELISGEFSREDMDEINSELESIIKSSLPEIPQNEIVIPKEKEPVKEKKGENLTYKLYLIDILNLTISFLKEASKAEKEKKVLVMAD